MSGAEGSSVRGGGVGDGAGSASWSCAPSSMASAGAGVAGAGGEAATAEPEVESLLGVEHATGPSDSAKTTDVMVVMPRAMSAEG